MNTTERCMICDRTYSLDEAPFVVTLAEGTCSEHADAVLMRTAEQQLRSVIPGRQHDAKHLLDDVKDWSPVAADAKGVYLYGDVGRGKTYQAAALVKRSWMLWMRAHATTPKIEWWQVGILLQSMRATMDSKRGGSAGALTERLYVCDVLVLDDLGAERVTDWTREQILLIIGERYDRKRITIITSNFALGRLADRLTPPEDPEDPVGRRIASRIAEACERVEVTGPDRRLA